MKVYSHVVCGVDFSQLSDRAAERALAIAQQNECRLTFLHVIEYFPEDRSSGVVPPECTDPAVYLRDVAKERMTGLMERIGCAAAVQEVAFNECAAWHEIVRFAGETGADLIVVGCHGRHGVTSLIGSTANGLINRAPCDVLAVRPQQ